MDHVHVSQNCSAFPARDGGGMHQVLTQEKYLFRTSQSKDRVRRGHFCRAMRVLANSLAPAIPCQRQRLPSTSYVCAPLPNCLYVRDGVLRCSKQNRMRSGPLTCRSAVTVESLQTTPSTSYQYDRLRGKQVCFSSRLHLYQGSFQRDKVVA